MSKSEKKEYIVIIGNALLWNMGIRISFKEEENQWDSNKIPLKTIGTIRDKEFVKTFYSINTNSPILQEREERKDKIINCDYSKVGISTIVADLGINDDNKYNLEMML